MLIVSNATESEPLLESNYEKYEEQNAAALQITFNSYRSENNYGHELLDYEVLIEDEDGHEYKVKQYFRNGNEKRITATHIYYELSGVWKYDIYGGTKTFDDLASWLFLETGWTFENVDITGYQLVPNFGENNVLQLIQILLAAFNCECEILPGKRVRFAKLIAEDNDLQYRYKHNLNDLTENVDTTSIKTQIKGFGANGLVVTYTSPLAENPLFGVRVAEPIYNEDITESEDMLALLQAELPAIPETVIEISVTEVDGNVGDYVWIIHEEYDLQYQTRILSKKTKRNYKESTVTTGNVIPTDITDILINQKVEIDENAKVTRSKFEQTNDRITMEVEEIGGSIAALNIKADEISLSVNNRITNEVAAINVRADAIETSVQDLDKNLSSKITQTASTIRAEVSNEVTKIDGKISTTNSNVASLQVQANSISSTVSSQQTTISNLGTRVTNAESSISQTASQISSKVSYTDYNGNTIVSKINQDAYGVTISASRINLNGAVIVNGSISGATNIDVSNNIRVGNAIYFNGMNYIDNAGGGMDINVWNETTLTTTQLDLYGRANFMRDVTFNANVSGVAKSDTYGLGIAFNGRDRLYVRINGSDVGYVVLS